MWCTDLYFLGESGREHESLTCASRGHVILLNYTPNLRLKTHVQHSVCLVQNQESTDRVSYVSKSSTN